MLTNQFTLINVQTTILRKLNEFCSSEYPIYSILKYSFTIVKIHFFILKLLINSVIVHDAHVMENTRCCISL